MPVAVAGAGKSTLAKRLAKENNGLRVVSSDDIRQEVYGSAENQANPKYIFDLMEQRCVDLLNEGCDVFYDATNTERKFRKETLANIRKNVSGVHIVAYVFPVDIERAIRQNAGRDRKVPETVIRMMADRIEAEPPMLKEGFDEVVTLDV